MDGFDLEFLDSIRVDDSIDVAAKDAENEVRQNKINATLEPVVAVSLSSSESASEPASVLPQDSTETFENLLNTLIATHINPIALLHDKIWYKAAILQLKEQMCKT